MSVAKKYDDTIESSIEELNRLAMTQLTSEKFNHAMAYLNQALLKISLMPESVTKNSLNALTYNNLGCFYKRLGQVDKALDFFFQSIEFENNGGSSNESIANTHLNISFLISHKGEHEKSLRYAIKALMILQKGYKENPNLIVSIINSYQRIGFEYQTLQQYPQALQCFKKGYELCSKLKNGQALKKNFKQMYTKCIAEMGSEKNPNKTFPRNKSKKNTRTVHSPRSSLDSHTTV